MSRPPRWWRRMAGRTAEYFTMRQRLAATGHAAARATASEAVLESRQKRDAAEALMLQGLPAEALRLGVESLERLKLALASLDSAGVSWSPRMRRAVEKVERFGAGGGSPVELDSTATTEQTESLRRLIRAQLALDPWIEVEILDRRGLQKLRWHRWVLGALIALSPLLLALFVRSALRGINVRASSELEDTYAADRAIDGDPDTEWIPSGGGEEWLELRFPARRVHTLRVLEGDTLPKHAAKEVRVEYYLHGESYPGGSHEFGEHVPLQWIEFDGAGILCDRVRLTIASHYDATGAIADVEVN
jgi:hypothetical protein